MAFNKPSFNLPFGVFVAVQEPTDQRYGPYLSVNTPDVHGDIFHTDSPIFTEGNRHVGLTVGVIENNEVVEYWFKLGTANNDLVLKISGSGGAGTITGVIAGNGMTGGGNIGIVTLNVKGSSTIDSFADEIRVKHLSIRNVHLDTIDVAIDKQVLSYNAIQSKMEWTSSYGDDKHFEYVKAVESIEWIIDHNLNKKPSIVISNNSNTEIEGEIVYINLNRVIIRFNLPIKGKAIFN